MSKQDDKSSVITWQHSDQLDSRAIPLDKDGKLNKKTVLSRLREFFNFPDYFGNNWDAAYDLLLDQVDQLEGPVLWLFSIDDKSEVDETDLEVWGQLMKDLCAYAEPLGVQLRVIVQVGSKPV